MRTKKFAIAGALAGLSFLFVATSLPAAAQAPQFYAGKELSLYVGFTPGGGFDIFARTVAKYLGDHIPGQPNVVVRNMPGAGGATVVNYMLRSAPKDGTTIALLNPVMSTASFLTPEIAKWDAREFEWLGAPSSEINFCIFWDHSGIEKVEDLSGKDRPINMAGVGVSGVTLDALTLRYLMGWNWKMVMGYPGLIDAVNAGERREIDGSCGLTASTLKTRLVNEIKAKKVRVMLATSLLTHPDFPEARNAFELVKNEEQRQIMSLVFGPWKFGRPFMAPNGVPQERLDLLKKALMNVSADKRLIEDARKLGFDIEFVPADEIQALIKSFYAVPDEVKTKTREIIQVKQ